MDVLARLGSVNPPRQQLFQSGVRADPCKYRGYNMETVGNYFITVGNFNFVLLATGSLGPRVLSTADDTALRSHKFPRESLDRSN